MNALLFRRGFFEREALGLFAAFDPFLGVDSSFIRSHKAGRRHGFRTNAKPICSLYFFPREIAR